MRGSIPQFIVCNLIKSMTSLAIGLVVLLALGGTVVASDAARPGDMLYPLDRASEEVRLSITGDADAKAELRARHAEERMEEVESIVEEESENAEGGKVEGEGKVRIETAVRALDAFILDARASASSTANARAVLDRVSTRLEAMSDRIKGEMDARKDTDASVDVRANTNANASSSQGGVQGNSGVDVDVKGALDIY